MMAEKQFTGTITKINNDEKIDTDKVFQSMHELQQEIIHLLAKTFNSIRIEVDKNLEGRQYYLCVSPELFKEMEINARDSGKK